MIESSYQVSIKSILELKSEEIDAMVALYLSYYAGSSKDQVLNDLKTKDEILLLRYDGVLVGFTTYQFYHTTFNHRAIAVLFSGDTIVHHEHWGQQKFNFAWAKRVGAFYKTLKDEAFYWFLIVKGHRTYRYLPAFAHSFYPHYAVDRSDLKPLLDYLAYDKFQDAYNDESGIIHFKVSQGYLKPSYAYPTEREMHHDAVRYFIQQNPAYVSGDELACLCEIKEENFKPLTKRLMLG